MHGTAMRSAKLFFDVYGQSKQSGHVVEIGSQDVNGSIRSVCPKKFNYIGVDFIAGKGVDVVLDDPYILPFPDEAADIVITSSVFEHSEMFWLLFTEILRILKPNGLLYLNVPSNGQVHRYPSDNWRFYPDAGKALCVWAHRCGYSTELLESFVTPQEGGVWNDFVAVFVRSKNYAQNFPNRIYSNIKGAENIRLFGHTQILEAQEWPEDIKKRALAAKFLQIGSS